jgi:hypothetical protein
MASIQEHGVWYSIELTRLKIWHQITFLLEVEFLFFGFYVACLCIFTP